MREAALAYLPTGSHTLLLTFELLAVVWILGFSRQTQLHWPSGP